MENSTRKQALRVLESLLHDVQTERVKVVSIKSSRPLRSVQGPIKNGQHQEVTGEEVVEVVVVHG